MLAFPPDHTFLIQLASFFVLLVLLNRLLFAPFLELLAERDDRTSGDEDAAAAEMREAEELAERVERELAQARAAAMAEVEVLRREAREEEAQLFNRAKGEVRARLGELRVGIAAAKAEAEQSLRAEAGTLAEQMVAAVLGGRGTQ